MRLILGGDFVVTEARAVGRRSRREWLAWSGSTARKRLVQRELRFRVADDAVVALGGLGLRGQVAAVGLLDGRRDDDLLLGHPHAPKLDREPAQRPRVAGG